MKKTKKTPAEEKRKRAIYNVPIDEEAYQVFAELAKEIGYKITPTINMLLKDGAQAIKEGKDLVSIRAVELKKIIAKRY